LILRFFFALRRFFFDYAAFMRLFSLLCFHCRHHAMPLLMPLRRLLLIIISSAFIDDYWLSLSFITSSRICHFISCLISSQSSRHAFAFHCLHYAASSHAARRHAIICRRH